MQLADRLATIVRLCQQIHHTQVFWAAPTAINAHEYDSNVARPIGALHVMGRSVANTHIADRSGDVATRGPQWWWFYGMCRGPSWRVRRPVHRRLRYTANNPESHGNRAVTGEFISCYRRSLIPLSPVCVDRLGRFAIAQADQLPKVRLRGLRQFFLGWPLLGGWVLPAGPDGTGRRVAPSLKRVICSTKTPQYRIGCLANTSIYPQSPSARAAALWYSSRCSFANRTARSRNSGECGVMILFFCVCSIMGNPSKVLPYGTAGAVHGKSSAICDAVSEWLPVPQGGDRRREGRKRPSPTFRPRCQPAAWAADPCWAFAPLRQCGVPEPWRAGTVLLRPEVAESGHAPVHAQ